jgi:hypothetical protein
MDPVKKSVSFPNLQLRFASIHDMVDVATGYRQIRVLFPDFRSKVKKQATTAHTSVPPITQNDTASKCYRRAKRN